MQCPHFTQCKYVRVEGGGVCDLSGLQQESPFWEYSFIAGALDTYHQLSAGVLGLDCL